MNEFFNMGGYGFYVWLSYGLTAVTMIINMILPLIKEKTMKRELLMRIKRDQELKN